MSTKKKQSNISELTQAQRPKRYVRRNSLHTLHCREGSLNKLATMSQDLAPEFSQLHLPLQTPKKTQKQSPDVLTLQQLNEFGHEKEVMVKRETAQMRIRTPGRQKNELFQLYSHLKKQYQLRGEQIKELQMQNRKLNLLISEEHGKCKQFEEKVKINKVETKRLEKRAEKYKNESLQLQQEKISLLGHIQDIQKRSFGQQILTIQSYREKHLESEVRKLRILLQKTRGQRQQDLLTQISKLSDQRYNLQQKNSRLTLANDMLQKQLQDSQQACTQIRQSISKSVTSSIQYVELRQRYKKTLVEMRQMRKEIMQLQRSQDESQNGSAGNVLLDLSQSTLVGYQQ